MLGRRLWLKTAAMATLAWLPLRQGFAQQSAGARGVNQGRGAASLTDQLTKGLRAVTPEQNQFVQVVVEAVDQGRLPRALVNLVYKWALERNPSVPFPYFQYALTVLAKRRGISLLSTS